LRASKRSSFGEARAIAASPGSTFRVRNNSMRFLNQRSAAPRTANHSEVFCQQGGCRSSTRGAKKCAIGAISNGRQEGTMTTAKVREILASHGKLDASRIADDASLYEAGLTSFTAVQVMFALEAAFGVEFPEHMLNRQTFSSIARIAAAIDQVSNEMAG
jgi:acyl carrier protein